MEDRKLTILLIEDHADTARVMGKLLAYKGHRIVTASDCVEARRLAKHSHPDVLICDIGLPDGSGYDLCRQIKAEFPKMCAIAVSGYSLPSDRPAGVGEFNAYLLKPIDHKTLEDTINRVCLSGAEQSDQRKAV